MRGVSADHPKANTGFASREATINTSLVTTVRRGAASGRVWTAGTTGAGTPNTGLDRELH